MELLEVVNNIKELFKPFSRIEIGYTSHSCNTNYWVRVSGRCIYEYNWRLKKDRLWDDYLFDFTEHDGKDYLVIRACVSITESKLENNVLREAHTTVIHACQITKEEKEVLQKFSELERLTEKDLLGYTGADVVNKKYFTKVYPYDLNGNIDRSTDLSS